MNLAGRIAFVLCRPMQSGNIGSVARALKNMGFADLRLVAPVASARDRAATSMAVHGGDVLSASTIHRELAAALADRTLTVGTTCRPGLYRSGVESLRGAASELVAAAAVNRVAIVFGPEDHGLTNDELKACQRLVTIPTADDYRSLNLAQAVMLVAYELRMAAIAGPSNPTLAPPRAAAGEVEAMLERMAEALVGIGFLPADNPDHIMFALREIFGRSGLTPRELDILNGIARQIKWTAAGGAATLAKKRASGRKLR
ncbi:MAG: RNA methyltransferase [Deltaproteobacteria bacterium]|nr:RNA methyltransferase [Deltaproteobacteria bacterium]